MDKNKITVRKLDKIIERQTINATHTLDINGKSIRIHYFSNVDDLLGAYESETELDQEDSKKLTLEELDAVNDVLVDALELKAGEELTITL